MLIPDDIRSKLIPQDTILLGAVGSVAHGTKLDSSSPNFIDDIDLMGICIAPLTTYFGLENFEHKVVQHQEYDLCVYEIRKMFRLLLQQNPNVLTFLWLDASCYVDVSPLGQRIIENRHLFVSKAMYKPFMGYSSSQIADMKKGDHNGRFGEKRRNLYAKYGYDCKAAAHAIRLLRLGIEFLQTSAFQVLRPDAEELKAIKNGEWTLEQVQSESARLFDLAHVARDESTLPEQPDREGAEKLLIGILEDHFGEDVYLQRYSR